MKDDGEAEWQDSFTDERANIEVEIGTAEELCVRRDLLQCAMARLNDRERDILTERRLSDPPKTLKELGQIHGVSRERIRQIEGRAFRKLQEDIKASIVERHMVLE